ncbi:MULTISPECIES: glycosyltransferase family 4 protein [Lactiplantibacillus]|uniref:Glycosyltransferase family 4 protein n=1 Tax=Lactiplantibacillus pentosus TaxID=1589 RepID=A0AAX6LIN0_LACPE|nr:MULTISPECIES: glycosyltransferase family 4 protein [Lactiplantibacillus]MCG0631664.1 polysaccharide biosynthesis protein [Lactiplantibacillus plantarum]MCS8591322.1 glycosyltransferase family 1 protein [Lactiplantibacillus plantarum]MCT3303324.1 glycosyltransferase family 1 protein [Lactiplantibacillus pentosus]MDF2314423.1 glycosyltransferase family 4 protein [Lactiplantibacillus pentosus]QHM49165.1 D-inositol-3-phosphate glycosyltransferase [Lactiplantibacillus plantarum]
MIINFVLPRSTNTPMGGYKICFQYANKFAELGYSVHIYFVINAPAKSMQLMLAQIKGKTIKRTKYRSLNWFGINSNVNLHFDVSPEKIINLQNGVIIATHWSTADIVSESHVKNQNKFYFIQDFEDFDPNASTEDIIHTWKLPLKKIVISKWLVRKGIELGVKTYLIPNFIDLDEFMIDNFVPNIQRKKIVSFLWHDNPRKQSSMGLKIAKQLKSIDSEIEIACFGTTVPDDDTIDFKFIDATPSVLANNVYGKSAVYMMPSRKEGWGLTGLEAMNCGAVVVAIDNGGIHEYASKDSVVLVPNDEQKLLDSVLKTINNMKLRQNLASNGKKVAEQFSLDYSTQKFLNFLQQKGEIETDE